MKQPTKPAPQISRQQLKANRPMVLRRLAFLLHALPFLVPILSLVIQILQQSMSGGLGNALRTGSAWMMVLYPFAAILCGLAGLVCDILLLREKRTMGRCLLPLLSLLNIVAGVVMILEMGSTITF